MKNPVPNSAVLTIMNNLEKLENCKIRGNKVNRRKFI
jgi:hypothetical protein